MGTRSATRLGRVVDLFPSRKADILHLALRDPVFRELGGDLCDAHETLDRFLALPDAQDRPEIAECRAIIGELEAEVRRYLASRLP